MANRGQASTFSEDQISDFHEAFLLYDNRGDGKISVSLIGDVMRALGQNPTESEVKKLVHEHRADERVSFETFLPIFQVSEWKNIYSEDRHHHKSGRQIQISLSSPDCFYQFPAKERLCLSSVLYPKVNNILAIQESLETS